MAATAIMAFMSGCSSEPYVITAEEEYARQFYATFGTIAENQDWTAAKQADVTVNVPVPTTVKVYADFDGKTYLFGKYDVEAGSTTLKFDIPKGATNYQLKANGRKLAFTPGQTVDLTNGSRGLLNPGDNTFAGVTVTVEENTHGRMLTLTPETIDEAIDFLPESNNGAPDYDGTNFGKVTDNFLATAKEFYIFPEYWQTDGNSRNIIGVYWYVDADTEGAEHIVTRKAGWGENTEIDEEYFIIRVPFFQNPKDFMTPYDENDNALSFTDNSALVEDAAYYKSKGVHVDFNGTYVTFGFYLEQDGNVMYSESKLNEYCWINGYEGNWKRPSYVATFRNGEDTEHNDKRHLCFEDWYKGNWDLNDMVFRVYGFDNIADGSMEKGKITDIDKPDEGGNKDPVTPPTPPTPPTPGYGDDDDDDEVFPWIVACEDLGGTGDYDFNDIVFGVEHIAGTRFVYVTALAAGGTLPTRLYYTLDGTNKIQITGGTTDDTANPQDGNQYTVSSPDGSMNFEEWHKWFGSGWSSTDMINTDGNVNIGATVRITLSEADANKFSMSNEKKTAGWNDASITHLGGFTLEVDQTGGMTQTIKAPVRSFDPTDNIPQIFATNYKYNWPMEQVSINTTHAGTEEQAGTTPSGMTYNKGSFMHWVIAGDDANFHDTDPSVPSYTCKHNWVGYLNRNK
ncbi:MAG: hypothetical protein K2K37_10760 [Muribaculaceae bacterium]|nr:hypothetical protein [Muribaculaceae bacterium]